MIGRGNTIGAVLSAVTTLLFLSFVCALSAKAQFVVEHNESGHRLRGLHGVVSKQIVRSFESDKEASLVFREILSATGIPGFADRISLRASAETENAEAQIGENGQRYIFYNSAFMQELRARTGRYWSLVFVVAHEVGHHIAGHLDFKGENHRVELEADRYAGFILGRMGASYEDVAATARTIGTVEATSSHPARAQRIQAVSLGWSDGRGSPPTERKQETASISASPGLAGQRRPSERSPKPDSNNDAQQKAEIEAIANRFTLFRETGIHTNPYNSTVFTGGSGQGRGIANCMSYCLRNSGCRAFKSDDHICHVYRTSEFVHLKAENVTDWNAPRLQLVKEPGWVSGILRP